MKEPACSHDAEGGKCQLADVRSLSGPALLVSYRFSRAARRLLRWWALRNWPTTSSGPPGGKDSLRLRHKLAAWDDDFLVSLVANSVTRFPCAAGCRLQAIGCQFDHGSESVR
jgi:hypothetical protein